MSLCNFNLRLDKVDRVPLLVELLPRQPSRSTFEKTISLLLLFSAYCIQIPTFCIRLRSEDAPVQGTR